MPGIRERGTRRSDDDASKPGTPGILVDPLVDVLGLVAMKTLQRKPDFGVRELVWSFCQFLQKWQYQFGRVASGVAAGEKDAVELWKVTEEFVELREKFRFFLLVFEVDGGRGPDPMFDTVTLADFADGAIHLTARDLHQRIFAVVLKGNVLDGVDAEEDEVADVLIVLSDGPGIPGIRGGAIADLVSSQAILRRGPQVDAGGDLEFPLREVGMPQQVSDAVHRAADRRGFDGDALRFGGDEMEALRRFTRGVQNSDGRTVVAGGR